MDTKLSDLEDEMCAARAKSDRCQRHGRGSVALRRGADDAARKWFDAFLAEWSPDNLMRRAYHELHDLAVRAS